MTELKSDEEVLEFALSREIDAERFYADMAGQVDNPTLKKVLERLRKEEVVHRSRLELELMKKGRVVPDLAEPEEDLGLDETIVIGSEHVLAYKEILKRGMEREKKSFRLYIELATLMKDGEAREALLELAEQEAKHLALLEIEYDFVAVKKK